MDTQYIKLRFLAFYHLEILILIHEMFIFATLLILDGISEIGAYVRSNLCYLICLRHLNRSREVTNSIFLSEKTYFPSCVHTIFWVTIKYKYHDICSCRSKTGLFQVQINILNQIIMLKLSYYFSCIYNKRPMNWEDLTEFI